MRHYDRVSYRHLNDSERYRDYDYLGDDSWVGANERVPHGAMADDEPPWSTLGGYETGPFLNEHAFEGRRGQGREYGRDHGRHEGRDLGRDYVRESAQPRSLERSDGGGQMPRFVEGRARVAMRGVRTLGDAVRHPRDFVGRMVRGLFHGKGPKNWIRSDARIHDEVCELLAEHPAIDASGIDVVVKNGEVTLQGSVGDRRTKRLAESVLDDVLGLHDVHNRLNVAR